MQPRFGLLEQVNKLSKRLCGVIQVMGQEEVKEYLSGQIQNQMELQFQYGRSRVNPKGKEWKDLLDSISELLSHHLQQVSERLQLNMSLQTMQLNDRRRYMCRC